mmetsp:Transcript_4510/g.10854  ORF Transcript_4510/g.10854 Transcript_4510/m.10854 type:complete len:289 (+) Transcript_4510:524-1390(+)
MADWHRDLSVFSSVRSFPSSESFCSQSWSLVAARWATSASFRANSARSASVCCSLREARREARRRVSTSSSLATSWLRKAAFSSSLPFSRRPVLVSCCASAALLATSSSRGLRSCSFSRARPLCWSFKSPSCCRKDASALLCSRTSCSALAQMSFSFWSSVLVLLSSASLWSASRSFSAICAKVFSRRLHSSMPWRCSRRTLSSSSSLASTWQRSMHSDSSLFWHKSRLLANCSARRALCKASSRASWLRSSRFLAAQCLSRSRASFNCCCNIACSRLALAQVASKSR